LKCFSRKNVSHN